MKNEHQLPFLLGAQYYRAPTPEPECWPADLRRMKELGLNAVKFWVQWRWSHRLGDHFLFDDLDRLMDLAAENHLQVTLNTIFDVAPHWLYETYPDAKQIMNNGRVIEPYVVGHRQIGGHPGPCYNHPGALAERQKFMTQTVEHFREHPALDMWDVWNEPELSFPQRKAEIDTLACYCPHCKSGFEKWLHEKYQSLEALNQVWGRCYETWKQVELPRSSQTFADFIDWREFHIQTMTREAAWRLEIVRALDPERVRYLHVVPNVMSVFNSVSCAADDFEMAEMCDVFAATMNGGAVLAPQVLSAGRGKTCYNVESHLNFGSTAMHQRVLGLDDLLKDWLPQIGLGIRGFLFWQYRPEVLGLESPAWGMVNLDGSDRPITKAVAEFSERMTPHRDRLMACSPKPAEVGIWKSRKNEIFHFAMHGSLDTLVDSVEGYVGVLYRQSIPYRFISGEMLARGELDGLKILILPSPYCLTEAEARSLDQWVRGGGVLISEAHLGGYNATTGRHSRMLPGCGLAQAWEIKEVETTSSYHLKSNDFATSSISLQASETAQERAMPEDVRKALADFQKTGGLYYPIRLADGAIAWGAARYARIEGEGLQKEGGFERNAACLVSKAIGKGRLYSFGTNLGQGAKIDPTGLNLLMRQITAQTGVRPSAGLRGPGADQVRVDLIAEGDIPRYLMVYNRSDRDQTIQLEKMPDGKGIFSGMDWPLSKETAILVPGGWIDLIALQSN